MNVSTDPRDLQAESRPTIPVGEYAQRLTAVRGVMEELGLDLLVAYADDRAVFGPAHLRWLFDYAPHFEPACALIPRLGEPVLLTGAESDTYIRSSSRFAGEIFVTPEFTHPDEEYRFVVVTEVSEVIKHLESAQGAKIVKVGIAGLDLMGVRIHDTLSGLFPGDRLLDVNPQITSLRSVKSAAEIEVIRYAYRIAELGTGAAIAAIGAGATEREVAAEAEYVMRSLGSEGMGIDTIVAFGKEHTYPILHRTTNRRAREGDAIVLTIAPRYEGYHAAIGRTVFLGDVEPVVRTARDVAAEALRRTAAALRAGTTAREIDAIARGAVVEGGFGDHVLYSASHSVGVVEFEPPILSSFSDVVLAEDLVFSIDIPMFHCPWGGLRIEDGFRVTTGDAEPLQRLPRIIELS